MVDRIYVKTPYQDSTIRVEETNQYVHHLTSRYKNVIVGSIIPEYKARRRAASEH